MKINELESLLGITRGTIRFYEREGLVHPERKGNGYRDYSERDVKRLQSILVLRKIGVSMAEIRDLIDASESLDDVLENNLQRLVEQKEEIAAAMKLCREIKSAETTFEDMDSGHYLDRIHEMENGGSKFVELAKELAEVQETEFRRDGLLPKDKSASRFKKIFYLLGQLLIIFVFYLYLYGRTFISEEPLKMALTVSLLLTSMCILMALMAGFLIFIFKRRSGKELSEIDKALLRDFGAIIAAIIILVITFRIFAY